MLWSSTPQRYSTIIKYYHKILKRLSINTYDVSSDGGGLIHLFHPLICRCRRLAIIKLVCIFKAAGINNSNHSIRVFSNKFHLLFTDFFPRIFPCVITCRVWYFSLLLACALVLFTLILFTVQTFIPYNIISHQ